MEYVAMTIQNKIEVFN